MKIDRIEKRIKSNGLNQGKPAVFVMVGDCDDKEMSIADVYNSLNLVDKDLVVFDGVIDPLNYQQDLIDLMWLILQHNDDIKFEIETTGLLTLNDAFIRFVARKIQLQLNVSLRLVNLSGNEKWCISAKFMVDVFDLSQWSNTVFKVKVSHPKDFIIIGKFCESYRIQRQVVWVSGMGSLEDQFEKLEMISSHCIANGYNYHYFVDLKEELNDSKSGN